MASSTHEDNGNMYRNLSGIPDEKRMNGWEDGWIDGWMASWLLGAKEAVYLHVLFRTELSDWMIRFGETEKLGRNVRGLCKYIILSYIWRDLQRTTQNLV
jgi:hypothetical protein